MYILFANVKINLKLAIILFTSAFSFVWSRKVAKLAKIRKIGIKSNLEHKFYPNMIMMIEYIK